MATTTADAAAFAGNIPALYERLLVPMIFAPYAQDMAERVTAAQPASVLEIAAGTGAVTREMALRLPAATRIVATDLNAPMLAEAQAQGAARSVEWQQADAMKLPFPDASFDAVVCQFGVMFFPDRAAGIAEARRVLKPGGLFLFNTWDAIEHNHFADEVQRAVGGLFPADPPKFMERTPHGYYDSAAIARDVADAGFSGPTSIQTRTGRSRAESPRVAAMAYCQGTPLRAEIEARDASKLGAATDASTEALTRRFGPGAIEAKIQALVVSVSRPH